MQTTFFDIPEPTTTRKTRAYSVPEIKVVTVRETPLPDKLNMDRPELLHAFYESHIRTSANFREEQEQLVALFLDTRLRLLSWSVVHLGTINECMACPRDVFRPAIATGAYAVVILHNHPSGDPAPSEADRRMSIRMAEAGRLLQVQFLDSMVCGDVSPNHRPYYSFREAGLL